MSAEQVAEALERLYRDVELRRTLSIAAFDVARRPAYSWDRIAQQWDALFPRHGMAEAITLRPVSPADEKFLCDVYSSTRTEELAQVPWGDEQKAAFLQMQFDAQDRYYRESIRTAPST